MRLDESAREVAVAGAETRQGNGFVGDEVRGEEVEREREPENPFVVFEAEIFIRLLMLSSIFVQQSHFDIEPLSLWSFELFHFI